MQRTKMIEIFSANKSQWMIFAAITGVIFILTVIMYVWDRVVFTALLGKINPLLVVAGAAIIGMLCFVVALNKGWFTVDKPGGVRGYQIALGLSVFFFINAILLDWGFRFDRSINVLPPKGLLYYPVMGFIVEMLFHVLLLTLLMFAITNIFRGMDTGHAMWISIVLVSLVEPVFQVVIGLKEGGLDLFAILTGVHILLINLGQLAILKYYGFSTTFFLRMFYYSLWHVIWGVLRLKIFF